MRSYTVTRSNRAAIYDVEVGEVVYDCLYCDYGCANEDSRNTGIDHISVTRDPTGNYPFFTIPREDLS